MKGLADIYAPLRGVCDKGDVHSYISVYEEILAPYRNRTVNVLEVGIFKGGSLRMFEEYFHQGTVYGVDLCDQPLGLADLRPMIAEGTHHIHLLDAANPVQMTEHFGELKFDVIIEDASHSVSQQLSIYKNLRSRLAPGGIYVIEDIEDIDKSIGVFGSIDPQRSVEIIDRRWIKNRFDDVLVIIRE